MECIKILSFCDDKKKSFQSKNSHNNHDDDGEIKDGNGIRMEIAFTRHTQRRRNNKERETS